MLVSNRTIISREHFGIGFVLVEDINKKFGGVGGAVSKVNSRTGTEERLVSERRDRWLLVSFWEMHQLKKMIQMKIL